MKPRIITTEILSDRFSKLFEYTLQFPSVRDEGQMAAPITREVLKTSNSVVVMIYAEADDAFLFVQQYRTGVAFNESGDDPLLLECVAGMIDRDASPEDIARAEAMEEAGVKIDKLRLIATLYNSPGRMTEKTYLYFAEIDTAPVSGIFGLLEEGEEIRTHIIPRHDVYKMMDEGRFHDTMTFTALCWFRANRG